MHPPNRLSETFGRLIGRYSRWAVRTAPISFEGELPSGAAIVVTWHGLTMLALAVHAARKPHPYHAFVTPGMAGSVMRSWLVSSGMVPVPLPRDGGNPAAGLKQMAQALGEGWTAGIALDGPRGPARVLRPGALWLARLSGKPLIAVASAAQPAVRLPRWDRHLVPLPGSHIAIVYGEPIMVDRRAEIDEALCLRVTDALDAAEQRAWAILSSRSLLVESSARQWKRG